VLQRPASDYQEINERLRAKSRLISSDDNIVNNNDDKISASTDGVTIDDNRNVYKNDDNN